MKVLWLVSWYPNPIQPFDGDFIQRHARAAALYLPITVFYVSQYGERVAIDRDSDAESKTGNLKERIIFFQFKKTGFPLIDKIRYNIRYYRVYKKAIKGYLKTQGRPDLVHVHVPLKAGKIARWMLRRWGVPYIVSEHSSQYSRIAPDSFFKKKYLHRQSVKKIFRSARVVTNVSAAVGETIKSLFDLKDVTVIHNTVNTGFFNFSQTDLSKFRFIHVSSLNEQKNVEGILRTLRRLKELNKNFELVIVGPLQGELEKMTEGLGLGSIVSFRGEIPYPQVATEMKNASALVMFSRHENFPCVVIEALCCGLPVIASSVGGVSEAIDDDNGIIVRSENEDELLIAMNRMINEYSGYNREKIAFEAQQKFSYQAIGNQFTDLYDKVSKPT